MCAKVTKVGCGVAIFKNSSNDTVSNNIIICEFDQVDIDANNLYIAGTPCSQCSEGSK